MRLKDDQELHHSAQAVDESRIVETEMGIDVHAQTEISAERTRVAAFAMDPGNDPAWIGGIQEARWLTEPPLRVGTRVGRLASFLGRRTEYVLEVDELEPGARLRMVSVKGPFPMTVTYAFEDTGPSRTRATIRVEGDASGFYGLASSLLARAVRRSIMGDLQRLAKLLEGRTAEG
jgi:hypothetical protein